LQFSIKFISPEAIVRKFYPHWIFACASFCLCLASLTAQAELRLIPQPREVRAKDSIFRVSAKTSLVVLSKVKEDSFAAGLLHEDLKLSGKPKTASSAPSRQAIVLGRVDDPAMVKLLGSRQLNTTGIGNEGYILDVDENLAVVAGKDAPGLFYGIQTLRQMITQAQSGAEIAGAQIRDWPALQYRGTQVDISRGPVPKLDYLKQIVRTIAEYKMNQLNLYIEDAFPLAGKPLIGVLDDVHSVANFRELIAYAQPYHVEIVPATQACGHLHKVLRFELYSNMGEREHGTVLAADNDQAVAYLDDFYRQIAAVFPSPMVNIGCDETFELGLGKSADLVKKEGFGKVYARNVARAAQAARNHGKQPIFWGDMAVAHPDAINTLPKDLVVASWEYYPHDSYSKWIKPFKDAGMRFFVCPWVGNTGLIIPDYDSAAINIANFIDEGKKNGAIGTNVTVWSDSGETLYAPNWWTIVYGAANAWEENKVDVASFDGKFDWAFFRSSSDHALTEAIKELGRINPLMRKNMGTAWGPDYGGAGDEYYWKDPFGAGADEVSKSRPIVGEMRRTAEHAYTVLTERRDSVPYHGDTLDAVRFAALRLDALGMRYQYVQTMSEQYQTALARQSSPEPLTWQDRQLVRHNQSFIDLRDYNTRLREMYRQLWLSENLPLWLPNILEFWDQNTDLWVTRRDKLGLLSENWSKDKPLPPAESLGLVLPGTGE
jgi:hypothetical protein